MADMRTSQFLSQEICRRTLAAKEQARAAMTLVCKEKGKRREEGLGRGAFLLVPRLKRVNGNDQR